MTDQAFALYLGWVDGPASPVFHIHIELRRKLKGYGMPDFDAHALGSYFHRCQRKGLLPNTVDGYAERLSYLRRWAAKRGKGLITLTATDMESYFIEMMRQKPELSGYTINGRLQMFRQFYTYLREQGIVDSDPTETLFRVRPVKRQPILISPLTFRSVILAVRKRRSFYAVRNECILLVAFDTMLRLEEFSKIRVDEVHTYPERMIHILGKGRKERIVSFGEETAERLLIYMCRRAKQRMPGDLLFCTKNGKGITKRNMEHIFDRCGALAGVKMSPHLVRHSAATIMKGLLGDMELLRDILGHNSISTTEIYVHTPQIAVVDAYRRASPVSTALGQVNR